MEDEHDTDDGGTVMSAPQAQMVAEPAGAAVTMEGGSEEGRPESDQGKALKSLEVDGHSELILPSSATWWRRCLRYICGAQRGSKT